MDTPEDRRDAAIAEVIELGGVVLGSIPLAEPSDPHTITAYRLILGAPDLESRDELEQLQARIALPDHTEFVEWTEAPPIEEV